MDPYLIHHAALGYGTDRRLVARALSLAEPFPLPQAFLQASRFEGDPLIPENNAYLVARWVASLKAADLSDTAILDCMCNAASVNWKRPIWYRSVQWVKRLFRRMRT